MYLFAADSGFEPLPVYPRVQCPVVRLLGVHTRSAHTLVLWHRRWRMDNDFARVTKTRSLSDVRQEQQQDDERNQQVVATEERRGKLVFVWSNYSLPGVEKHRRAASHGIQDIVVRETLSASQPPQPPNKSPSTNIPLRPMSRRLRLMIFLGRTRMLQKILLYASMLWLLWLAVFVHQFKFATKSTGGHLLIPTCMQTNFLNTGPSQALDTQLSDADKLWTHDDFTSWQRRSLKWSIVEMIFDLNAQFAGGLLYSPHTICPSSTSI
jgi:hypothetical protein